MRGTEKVGNSASYYNARMRPAAWNKGVQGTPFGRSIARHMRKIAEI